MKNAQHPYILWLPSWYPNRLEPYNGDFIQRHARAVARNEDVHVIHVVKDGQAAVTNGILIETKCEGRLRETIVYYHVTPRRIRLIERLMSFRRYIALYQKAIRECITRQGKPQLVHLYIAYKAGLAALWLKRQYKVPYILSEQWTIYLPEAKPNFLDFPFFVRYLFRKIVRQAAGVMVVSDCLGQQLQRLFSISKPIVIPNVVDSTIFSYAEVYNGSNNRFVHISTLNYQKNPEALIKAFSLVKEKGYTFILDIIGPAVPSLVALCRQYGLEMNLFFHSEMPQQQLVQYIQRADALVLYSRFETFGCVIIEANACGVPVIVSDIPVLHENVTNGFNGLFAANENAVALADRIIYFIKNKQMFSKEEIARCTTEKYSYGQIGAQITAWYKLHRQAHSNY